MVVYANSSDMIHIGRVGENKATTVAFDVTDWIEEFGEGNFNLVVEKDSHTYPAAINLTGKKEILYNVKNIDENFPSGEYYLRDSENTGFYICFSLTESIKAKQIRYISVEPEGYFYIFFITDEDKEIRVPTERIVYDNTITQKKNIENYTTTYLERTYKEPKRYVLWQILNSDLQEAGLGKCMLDYRVNNTIVKSITYKTVVTNSLGENEQEEPEEYNWVELIIDEANYIKNKMTDANQYALESEAWAIGTKEGVVISVEDLQFNNNSKYWAEQAGIFSNEASDSATAAANSESIITDINNSAQTAKTAAIQAKNDAETARKEAEEFKEQAKTIALGDASILITETEFNDKINKVVTIYKWSSDLVV